MRTIKLEEYLQNEGIDFCSACKIAKSICDRYKQINEETSILKHGNRLKVTIPEFPGNEDLYLYHHEKKVVRELLPPKKRFTFPFIAPYKKPEKRYVEKIVPIVNDIFCDYFTEKRTIEMEAFGYRDFNQYVFINAGYDPMEDRLYLNVKIQNNLGGLP